ncbi:hypothetical protein GCM10009763_17040 [Dermacoccus profundi]|uniref:Uncharacterized protein n=2 Tax=Dermacoccus TaxID=57495 RepID=A0ABN2BJW7_9MICO
MAEASTSTPTLTRTGLTPFPASTWNLCGDRTSQQTNTAVQVRQGQGHYSSCPFLVTVRDAALSQVARTPDTSSFPLKVYSAYRKENVAGSDGYIDLTCSRRGGLVNCFRASDPDVDIWVQEGAA